MTIQNEIHWAEGLFLQPQHLQYMQRHFFEKLNREHRMAWRYPYGVIEAKVSDDQLENMRVSFDRLQAVMPSGVEVNVPGNAKLPSLDIKEAFAASSTGLTVSLGIPRWSSSSGNVIEKGSEQDWRAKRLYQVTEIERVDENTGSNPQPILVRSINARLLLDSDDRSDLEVLPLLRIVHATGEDVGFPRRDPQYIPPCLFISGSPSLAELVRDMTNQVAASRSELAIQINRGGFSVDAMRGVQFEQMLRLGILNRFSTRLDALTQVPTGVTPFEMFLELGQLLAELASLHPEQDQFATHRYEHDDPAMGFKVLCDGIRGLLKGVVQARYLKVPFTRIAESNVLLASLSDEALSQANQYFLAIKTKQDPSGLAQLVLDRDRFKLMPQSMVDKRVRGIQLAQELYPPVELPAQIGLHYFRIVRAESTRLWASVEQDKLLAARWPELDTSDCELTLYMTLPSTEA